jgi:hypothetical protein
MIDLSTDLPLLGRFGRELVAGSARSGFATPALGHYAAAEVDAARLVWVERIFDEYRSVAIFAELLRLLVDLEAPFAASCAVQQLIADELRHTELTARVASWLGGYADLDIDLRDVGLPPRPAGESDAQRALRIVARELVVVEEESLTVLAAYRNATTEPAIRAVFSQLLRDEVRHAAAGRALLTLFEAGPLATETVELRAALPELMAADRADIRATYRATAIDGPGRALGASLRAGDVQYGA